MSHRGAADLQRLQFFPPLDVLKETEGVKVCFARAYFDTGVE